MQASGVLISHANRLIVWKEHLAEEMLVKVTVASDCRCVLVLETFVTLVAQWQTYVPNDELYWGRCLRAPIADSTHIELANSSKIQVVARVYSRKTMCIYNYKSTG
jgi:hypothetical protein